MPRTKRRRVKGHGSVYRKGRTWSVSWMENGERRYSHGYPTRDLAEEVRAKIALDLAGGRGGLPKVIGKRSLAVLAEAWLERRKTTHRAARNDRGRWTNHVAPALGHLQPDAVDTGLLRKLIEKKLGEKQSSTSVRLMIRLVSTLYTDLIEQGYATKNPARMLPKATKRLIRPSHDPKKTPFIEKRADVVRVYQALPEPVNIAFAIGALAGLRTGELQGLKWAHVDLKGRRFHVQESITGPLKDDDTRIVPMVAGLAKVLEAWRAKHPDDVRVCPPLRRRVRQAVREHTLHKVLRKTLGELQLPDVTWYQATRHTFASHWVLAGGSIEKLRDIMGHSTVLVTERYAHLRPDLFLPADLERADLALTS